MKEIKLDLHFQQGCQIGLIKSGYCWQYLVPSINKPQDSYLCSLLKPGDFVFALSPFLRDHCEAIEFGINGCEIDWLDRDQIEFDILKILESNKSFLLTHVRLLNSSYIRRKDKCLTPNERRVFDMVEIDYTDNKHNYLSKRKMLTP